MEFFENMDPEDIDGLLPELDELDSLPDVLGEYREMDTEEDE